MHRLMNLFGTFVAGLGLFAFVGTVYAATPAGRAAYSNVTQANRAGVTTSVSSQRMPTMPTLPNFTVGNTSVDLPTNVTPSYPDNPDDPDNPDNPDNPDEPDNPDDPDVPATECPDGGVENSEYSVDDCMDDILMCVNTGALPGGINDLFNEDLRNSIVNGMNLCASQVERCIADVRRNCANVYRTSADVWIDFNSRRVQPAYYNFVLRKTGLTPNQAENTCRLLDVNTYGSSFDAVANSGNVTAEYNIQVGAYNSQGGNMLVKNNPLGADLNYGNSGVDGERGHYARWDPTTAECWVRVAAYNKNSQIKNSWLFGAAGNDQPAEVWRLAGDTFTCNRDLFGFSLMNQTNTAAVVGMGGGALVGAGVGAIAGHGARAFDCTKNSHREMLTEELRADANLGSISEYLEDPISATVGVITENQCREVVELYNRFVQVEEALKKCNTVKVTYEETTIYSQASVACGKYVVLEDCFANVPELAPCVGRGFTTAQQCADFIAEQNAATADALAGNNSGNSENEFCSFQPLNLARARGESIYCNAGNGECVGAVQIEPDVERLDDIFTAEIKDLLLNGEESNMGKSIGIGVGVGAGAGGLATAITAFVERSNINCRVGDGLAQVGYGKSYSIESLKDFYVKWNLNLPDTISPTGTAVDCESWKRACGTITDLNQCKSAQINYKPADAVTMTLVPTACTVSGSACIENYPVAKSYGACE